MSSEYLWQTDFMSRIAAKLSISVEDLEAAEWDYTIHDDDEGNPTGVEVTVNGRTLQLGPEVVPPMPEE